MDFVWIDFEPYRDAPFDFSKYDGFVTWAKNNDIEIIPILMHIPQWLNNATDIDRYGGFDIPTGQGFNDFVARYGQFVYKIVEHYSGSIQYFEIWNEPNIIGFWNDPEATLLWDFFNRGTAIQKYVRLLKEAYTQAKAANPNCIVITGGIDADDIYLQGMYDYGAKGYFDMVGLHPYFYADCPTGLNYDPDYVDLSFWDPSQFPRISLMKDVMVANGDGAKKIIITELGVDGESGPEGATTEEIQARALRRVFEKIDHDPGYPYVVGVMWFHLRTDDGNYGLLREDYTPRQMYYAYKQLIATNST
jgi:hypothetical protein